MESSPAPRWIASVGELFQRIELVTTTLLFTEYRPALRLPAGLSAIVQLMNRALLSAQYTTAPFGSLARLPTIRQLAMVGLPAEHRIAAASSSVPSVITKPCSKQPRPSPCVKLTTGPVPPPSITGHRGLLASAGSNPVSRIRLPSRSMFSW